MKNILHLLAAFISVFSFSDVLNLPSGEAQDTNQAGLVIEYSDGGVDTYCVSFSEDSLTGYELLQASGITLESSFDAMGAAVCSINGVGCSIDNCFCDFPPNYWSYWQQNNGEWTYSDSGASNSEVVDNAIEGWLYGDGSAPSKTYTIDEICGAAEEAEPTATPEEVVIEENEEDTGDTTEEEVTEEEVIEEDAAVEEITETETPVPTETPLPTETPAQVVEQSAQVRALEAYPAGASTEIIPASTEAPAVSPTLAVVDQSAAAAPAPVVETSGGSGMIKYAAFGGILVILLAAGGFILRKRE